jgi:hypothetical protein
MILRRYPLKIYGLGGGEMVMVMELGMEWKDVDFFAFYALQTF